MCRFQRFSGMAKPGMNPDIPQRCSGIERGPAEYPSRRKALICAGFQAGVKDVKDFPPSFPSMHSRYESSSTFLFSQ
jgi:hypothetical protein